jgi:short-subunit dehydrogenase
MLGGMTYFSRTLITGASSGIGGALARELAAPGVTLHLSGRNQARLELTARSCLDRGATVQTALLDVRDAAAMATWIGSVAPLDLVVANAGVSARSSGPEPELPERIRTIFAVNLDGMLNTVLPAMALMEHQPPGLDGLRGRIAVIASIAAFIAVPRSASYCASKAAVDAWTVANAPDARARGIALTSVCPGYIRTAMTARNQFPMPGLMDADRAARIIVRGIATGRVRIAFPWWMAAAARIGALLPRRLTGPLLARQPGKAPNRAL